MTNLMTFTTKRCTLFFLIFAIFPLCLRAHPHNWITVKSEFLIDEKGLLTEIHQYWEFDIYFSMMTLADVLHESKIQPNSFQMLAKDMVNNMQSYNYFSKLKIDKQPIALPKPNDYSLSTVTNEGQQQLSLHMRFQLTLPQQITDKTLVWQVFDPTFFIDMRHHDTSQVIIRAQNEAKCTTRIELPEPSDEVIDYAFSLDRTQKNTQGLGSEFAEKVIIQCL
jgi:ABC-type uncharacterized transport system substrate-binding protein